MAKVEKLIKNIKEQHLGNSNRQVLIVEGDDDEMVFSTFLSKKYPDKESQWLITAAGSKNSVLAILKKQSDWLGIVDKDEWSEDIIQQQQQDNPNLWVLPRFCIENYLIVPFELWQALPENQQSKIGGGLQQLQQEIEIELPKWLAHGVLWSVINPLWAGLRARGFKEDLLSPDMVANEQGIKDKLNQWHDFLEPEQLWEKFTNCLEQAKKLSPEHQLKHWIHGKKFYEQVIQSSLNKLLGQKPVNERMKAIIRTSEVPDDLQGLWEKMGL